SYLDQQRVAPGTQMFKRVTGSVPAHNGRRTIRAFAMDVDADGKEELMVPNSRVSGYEYCGGEPQTLLPGGEHAFFCGTDFDDPAIAVRFDHYDQSVFTWDAWKFIEQADGSYAIMIV